MLRLYRLLGLFLLFDSLLNFFTFGYPHCPLIRLGEESRHELPIADDLLSDSSAYLQNVHGKGTLHQELLLLISFELERQTYQL
jgi:hypothetical protein